MHASQAFDKRWLTLKKRVVDINDANDVLIAGTLRWCLAFCLRWAETVEGGGSQGELATSSGVADPFCSQGSLLAPSCWKPSPKQAAQALSPQTDQALHQREVSSKSSLVKDADVRRPLLHHRSVQRVATSLNSFAWLELKGQSRCSHGISLELPMGTQQGNLEC